MCSTVRYLVTCTYIFKEHPQHIQYRITHINWYFQNTAITLSIYLSIYIYLYLSIYLSNINEFSYENWLSLHKADSIQLRLSDQQGNRPIQMIQTESNWSCVVNSYSCEPNYKCTYIKSNQSQTTRRAVQVICICAWRGALWDTWNLRLQYTLYLYLCAQEKTE